MRFSPLSFALGVAVASLAPILSRVFRPLAVEAAAAGMGMFEDARRIFAEQIETLEDILAEARARREHLAGEAMASAPEADSPDESAEASAERPAAVRTQPPA
jgi:Protein of unknown function (DUF5132)